MNITFEALMRVLKHDGGEPYSKYVIEDFEGDQIRAEKLHVLDFNTMRSWLIDEIAIDEYGVVYIILNSGSFKAFNFKGINE